MNITKDNVQELNEAKMINVIKNGSSRDIALVVSAVTATPRVLALAMKHFSEQVKIQAASNPNADDTVIELAVRSSYESVVKAAITNLSISPKMLQKAYSLVAHQELKCLILHNPKTPQVVFTWALKEGPLIKSSAARSPFVPKDILLKLSVDYDVNTRRNVTKNSKTTLLMLIKATKDPNKVVAEAAEEALRYRKQTARIKE